jgi:hypothetical protein
MIPTLTTTPETAETPLPAPAAAYRDEAPADEIAAEREREAAYSAQHEWAGKTLTPFSISRKACWLQHRLSMGAPDLRRCLADLDAFFADACRILWLCSVQPDEFAAVRSNPDRMQAVIDAWTDANIPEGQQAAATLTAFRIYSAAVANRHIPAPSKNRNPEDLGN